MCCFSLLLPIVMLLAAILVISSYDERGGLKLCKPAGLTLCLSSFLSHCRSPYCYGPFLHLVLINEFTKPVLHHHEGKILMTLSTLQSSSLHVYSNEQILNSLMDSEIRIEFCVHFLCSSVIQFSSI